MPKLTVRVRNLSSLQAKVKRSGWLVQGAVFQALSSLSDPIKRDIKQDLSRPKSGPITKRYRPARLVKVSLPGEAPAEDLGLLVNSIDVVADPVQFNMVISAAAPYARELEYGTSKMAARPFLRPALTRWRERIINAIHVAIKEALSRV